MEKIIKALVAIEEKRKIKILHACETGSRAWGFPSPDSDYDVRFIYKHERDWYLSLGARKDTIEFPVENDFDITGWDLKKSLVLLKRSNAALIERFQSPVEYMVDAFFKDEMKSLVEVYYSPVAVFYHHHSLAKKFWEEMKDQKQVRLKNYFYLLRSLLSCNWIAGSREVIPMHIEGLMTVIDEKWRTTIRDLIKLKATVGEKYIHTKDEELDGWIDELWQFIDKSKNGLGVNNADYSLLDAFFLKMLSTDADN